MGVKEEGVGGDSGDLEQVSAVQRDAEGVHAGVKVEGCDKEGRDHLH